MMKHYSIFMLMVMAVLTMMSCHDHETYADQKDRERSAINKFIADRGINVISEAQFLAQDSTTDVTKNQYVLFETTGVYMQIVNKGCGQKIKRGETVTVLSRFNEYNILTDSLILTNNTLVYSGIVDKMSIENHSGTFTGTFDASSSVMVIAYNSTAVPSGWLIPFRYVNVGRPESGDDELAQVKLIVPHSQGQQYASQGVYPCYYELTFQRGR